VVDGEQALFVHAHQWNKLRRCDEFLDWLIRHNLTGKRLHKWLREQFQMKSLAPAQWVLMKIDGDKETKAIRVGRDFILG
jgi:hypothetical protein